MATVRPYTNFNAKADSETLEKAMKGMGTDEQTIIDVLAARSTAQRKEIASQYKAMYGKDLETRLKKELSGNFEKAVLLSFYDPYEIAAKACNKAIKGVGTTERVLLQVICTSTNEELAKINAVYKAEFGKELEDDVKGDCGGDFGRLLIALLQCSRQTSCCPKQALVDAAALYEAGEGKLGTDESRVTELFATRSWEQIKSMNKAYEQHVGHDLLKAIDKETSGDYKAALQLIVKTSMCRIAAVAELLYNSTKGAGTHDDDLQRLIMSHSENDLGVIAEAYYRIYGKTLSDNVKSDTSGDYKRWLMTIIG